MNYTCFHGFELVGPEYRVCQANGEWSEEPPICRPLVCDTPVIAVENINMYVNLL